MLIGLITLSAALLAWAAASAAPRPDDTARDQASEARRRRYLAEHPTRVNSLDVERRIAGHLSRDHVREVADRAERLGLSPVAMWAWADRYDEELLVLAVRAGMGAPAFERHLAEGTAPDRRALELFARLAPEAASPSTGSPGPLPSTRRLVRQELRAFRSLPTISEPGLGGSSR